MEDSLKPGFDVVKAAKDYGISLSTLYKILGQKEKTVFNAVKHLEKVSLALSVQAAIQKQAKVTEFFKK